MLRYSEASGRIADWAGWFRGRAQTMRRALPALPAAYPRRAGTARRCIWISQCLLALMIAGCHAQSPSADSSLTNDPRVLHIGGANIIQELPPPLASLSTDDVHTWIYKAANAVTHYYGHFPVKTVQLTVEADEGRGVHGGQEVGGNAIHISLGRETRAADLDDDWTLTHEMFHLGFPSLDEEYHYMEEGLSDYLEPLARARLGYISPEKVWHDFMEGMPQGQPEAGDEGLDRTHTWGRTYWGGAIFWLLTDVRIRQETNNQKSLDDAIRAIVAAGGDGGHHWPLERVLETGDRATSTHVLHEVHAELGLHPARADLDGLWQKLGIRRRRGSVEFDDSAPLASIRKSMTATIKTH